MKDTANQKLATVGQIIEIANTMQSSIAKILVERNFSFDQAKTLIEKIGKNSLQTISGMAVNKIFNLVPGDPALSYKKDLQDFFKTIYGLTIDVSKIPFPEIEGYNHFMIVPQGFSAGHIYGRFVKVELTFTKYMHKPIDLLKRNEQLRPETYAFAYRGEIEPDQKHIGKSYKDFIVEDSRYMTINEYMLCCQFMWWKHGVLFDQKGCTITSTLANDNVVMHGYCRKSMFKLGCTYFTKGTPGDGPREIKLVD